MDEALPDDPEERLAKARERLKSLHDEPNSGLPENGSPSDRGIGAADEERVRATAVAGRLTGLEIDPRAMRNSPAELGEHIAAAANAALDDLRARSASASTEPVVDPAALVQTLRAVQEQGMRQMALINQAVGEALAKARASMR
ncbi:YbaB/EbfC family DNA-binding protein [Actinomadura decatromicini]|uniref:YbaB/EbfC family DNA-binding protein n=1 Tax=Actinomadura decatromicini TaxID=2604572 RepID=A0A5D3FKW7_9ACTN|nr:YbaB/EbfC family DNA-binding protein [Actinomadura decatromicini]TYK48931.1 YbaB/EbfC family DNA-binding protein [Actinomadura decatromicini]